MKTFSIGLVALATLISSCNRDRGETSHKVIDETNTVVELADSWPEEGPELLWSFEGLGRGYGGPLVTAEGIFVNAEEKGNSYTLKLDHTGELIWKSPNGTEFIGSGYSASFPGTRSAPSFKGMNVYALSGMGSLSCFDHQKGNVVWAKDIITELYGRPGEFGYSDSPVVDDENVYCFAGGKTNNIVALDRLTGELKWSTPVLEDYYSYSTPILLRLANTNVLTGTSRNYIWVVDRKDGQLLSYYQLEDISEGFEHCNSVVYHEGNLFFVASEENGQGTVKLQLSHDGKTLSEVWRNRKVTNIFGGFVLVDKFLYTTLENKKLICLDTETGRIRHTVRAESGSIVHAGNKLIVYGHNGLVQLFLLSAGKPELKSEMRIEKGSGQHFSFPVIYEGVMYIRRGDTLMAFEVSRNLIL